MGTCLIFTSIGWSGKVYEPMALVVGAMICIAAANGGGTSQDLKIGYIVGATPKYHVYTGIMSHGAYSLLGVAFFVVMCGMLYRLAVKKG